jgi:hypothetical protein
VGWGPLAPGEVWAGVGTPTLYLKTTSTFARYAPSQDAREIDPAGFTATPRDPLTAAAFLESLPSLRISRDRLDYEASDRPGVIRLSPSPPPAWRSCSGTRAHRRNLLRGSDLHGHYRDESAGEKDDGEETEA